MGKINLTNVTAVVALSYLALIPAAAYVGYKTLKDIDSDVDSLWQEVMKDEYVRPANIFSVGLLKRFRKL